VLLAGVLAPPGWADDWPQWRGPGRDGVWPAKGLPEAFPPGGLKPRWTRPVGGGYGGLAVAAGRVYLLDRQKEPREVERVVCLAAADGKPLWAHAYPVAYGKLDYGNGPRSTPTVYGGRVYAFGALGHLHCLDAATGKALWARDTARDFQGRVPTWGHACSPLLDGGRLVVQVGGEGACLVALDRHSGREVWRSLSDRPGYSSPVLIDTGGRQQLVYWAAEHLSGLDPVTGRVLWQVPHTTSYDVTISDPVLHEGVLLVSDYWEGSLAVRLDGRGRDPRVLWRGRRPLSLLMSTPLCRGGYAYALDRHDGLKCVELRTGREKWGGQHVTPKGQNPHATLVWAGDRALILNAKGELILAELSPEGYREVSRAKVIGDTWAAPAFAGGCLFARNDREVVCVPLEKWRGEDQVSPPPPAAQVGGAHRTPPLPHRLSRSSQNRCCRQRTSRRTSPSRRRGRHPSRGTGSRGCQTGEAFAPLASLTESAGRTAPMLPWSAKALTGMSPSRPPRATAKVGRGVPPSPGLCRPARP
jgi:outer membrane protein assembly factor BamB